MSTTLGELKIDQKVTQSHAQDVRSYISSWSPVKIPIRLVVSVLMSASLTMVFSASATAASEEANESESSEQAAGGPISVLGLDDSPDLDVGAPILLSVVNTDVETRTVSLELSSSAIGFVDPDTHEPISVPSVLILDGGKVDVAIGVLDVAMFESLTEAQLTLYGAGVPYTQVDIPLGELPGDSDRPELPSEIAFDGLDLTPVFIPDVNWGLEGLEVIEPWSIESPPKSGDLGLGSDEDQLAGVAVSEAGETAELWLVDNHLEARGIPESGVFKGQVTIDDSTHDIVVSVRDLILWPIAILLVGLFLATIIDRSINYTMPKERLRLRIEDVRNRFKSEQQLVQNSLKPLRTIECLKGRVPSETLQIVETRNENGLVDQQIEEVWRDFHRSTTGEERRAVYESEVLKKLSEHYATYSSLVRSFRADASLLDHLGRHAQATDGDLPQESSLMTWFEAELFRPAILTDASLLLEKKASLSELREVGALALAIDERLHRSYDEVKGPNRQTIEQLFHRLWRNQPANRKQLMDHFQKVDAEASKLVSDESPQAIALMEASDLGPSETMQLSTEKPPLGQTLASTVKTGFGINVVSTVLVLASGLAILYFPNPSFGSWGDYIGALGWGAAVGEGVEIARRLPFLVQ